MALMKSTSKGMQEKTVIGGKWYKLDTYYESLSEVLCCRFLSLFRFSYSVPVVMYLPFTLDDTYGCVSDSFTSDYEQVVTLYRLLLRDNNKKFYEQFDNKPEEAYTVLLNCGLKYAKDFGYYLTYLFLIDLLIRNNDRHTNNIALIRNSVDASYRVAPLFDNGSALFQDKSKRYSCLECLNTFNTTQPFGLTYEEQYKQANKYYPIESECISNVLDLRDLDLTHYPQWLLTRSVDVLYATTLKYFNVRLKVLL